MNHQPLIPARLVQLGAGVLCAALVTNCASLIQSINSMGGNNSSSSSTADSEPPRYVGPITVTNQSASSICGVDLYHWDRTVEFRTERFADSPIATGESRTFEFPFALDRIRLMDCTGTTVLWDSIIPYNTGLWDEIVPTTGAITLVDSGTEVREGDAVVLVAENTPLAQYFGPQGSLHAANIGGLLDAAREQTSYRWPAGVEWVTVSSNDYEIERDDYGNITHRSFRAWFGIRGEDNECIAELSEIQHQYDGSSYSTHPRIIGGAGARAFIPCEVHEQAGSGGPPPAAVRPAGGAAPAAAPAATGRCENTCRTSNDNECDDGGPGSLYSICALGTDCNDCGPR